MSFRKVKSPSYIVDLLILIGATLIIYWPAAFNVYSFKNDALVQYLPFRYHLSESIQHGYFPFWSPYLYTGFPMHADLQGEVWNPFVLLISLFTQYNMSVLQWEVLLYLAIAAAGMYHFLHSLGCSRLIKLCGAVGYVCCGYITDSASVIPWVASAAFLPFVFNYFYLCLRDPSFLNSLRFSISISLLFLCGYPSFFIYCCYILFAGLICWVIRNYHSPLLQKIFFHLGIASILFLLVCSPAIISYIEFLPYYSRGGGLDLEKSNTNSFPVFSSISYLLPQAVSKPHPWIHTDISARNAYVGIFILLFFLLSFFRRYNGLKKFIIVVIIFSFLFSLGNATPLHDWCYHLLPFIRTFRHPATIRIFTSMGIILIGSMVINDFFNEPHPKMIKMSRIISLLIIILLVGFIIYYFVTHDDSNLSGQNFGNFKHFLDDLRFVDFAIFEGALQILFLSAFILLTFRKNISVKIFAVLFAANSIIFAWMALPFTFFSQVKTSTINNYLRSFPKGYPFPDINAHVNTNINSDSTGVNPYGYEPFYNKTISFQDYVITPTTNIDYERFGADKKLRETLNNYHFAYLADTVLQIFKGDTALRGDKKLIAIVEDPQPDIHHISSDGTIALKKFNPNYFLFEVNLNDNGFLNLFQQYNHNWKAKVNGKDVDVFRTNLAFMGVYVPKGVCIVEFAYKPRYVILAMKISGITIVLLIISLIFILYSRKHQLKS
jgi:Bacterial membrane protein YfhO